MPQLSPVRVSSLLTWRLKIVGGWEWIEVIGAGFETSWAGRAVRGGGK
jgi:hypothetical protein